MGGTWTPGSPKMFSKAVLLLPIYTEGHSCPVPNSTHRELQAPHAEPKHEVLPTLFGDGYGMYEVRKGSFVFSFVLNTA